jgi:hypothetical protein
LFQPSNPFHIFLPSASHGWIQCSKGTTWLLCSLFFSLSICVCPNLYMFFLGWSYFLNFVCPVHGSYGRLLDRNCSLLIWVYAFMSEFRFCSFSFSNKRNHMSLNTIFSDYIVNSYVNYFCMLRIHTSCSSTCTDYSMACAQGSVNCRHLIDWCVHYTTSICGGEGVDMNCTVSSLTG